MTKSTFSFILFFAVMLCGAHPVLAGEGDGLDYTFFKAGDYFPLQGLCSHNIVDASPLPFPRCHSGYKPANGTNLCESTWSCHGAGMKMLKAKYMNGLRICAYIDNNGSQGYFVPMNTAEEWLAFSNPSNTPPDMRVVTGCPGGVIHVCGNRYLLPDTRASDDPSQTFHFQITESYSVDWSCPATIQTVDNAGKTRNESVTHCGEWKHTETGTCPSQEPL